MYLLEHKLQESDDGTVLELTLLPALRRFNNLDLRKTLLPSLLIFQILLGAFRLVQGPVQIVLNSTCTSTTPAPQRF
ncbi:hypothetical protein UPYG_G00284090 [Umbra pygmaea]|uniref:Uncharacterized protein n=1 Tax=Umbra pygmaea TaxID=75934 RepID=A0ABD0W819_UMBPY